MDYEEMRLWLDVAGLLVVLLGSAYAVWNNRTRATAQAFKALESSQSKLESRLALVENNAKQQPGHKEIHEVHYRVDQVGHSVSNIEGTLEQVKNSLTLIHTHLLEKS